MKRILIAVLVAAAWAVSLAEVALARGGDAAHGVTTFACAGDCL